MSKILSISGSKTFQGRIQVPGDKSISHRAVFLAALADGQCRITGFLPGLDCLTTVKAFEKMGVKIIRETQTTLNVFGNGGLKGLCEPSDILACENSGTTARLLMGVLSGCPFFSVLTGDKSLSTRPMRRVLEPLKQMGAAIWGRARHSLLPIAIQGIELSGISYALPVPSAQVKSAILLAGLAAEGETKIFESIPSRDHTERMLKAMGVECFKNMGNITLKGKTNLSAIDFSVPGDPSSAAFFIVGAAAHPGSDLIVQGVSLNPTRTGYIEVLKAMGANITILEQWHDNIDPIGDLRVRGGPLRGISIDPSLVPNIIDEIPVLSVAMAVAEGVSKISGAEELRKKESDRISAIVKEFQKFGVEISEKNDGFEILGKSHFRAPEFSDSYFDHRIAMALAILGTISDGTTRIKGSECISISFPSFESLLHKVIATSEL